MSEEERSLHRDRTQLPPRSRKVIPESIRVLQSARSVACGLAYPPESAPPLPPSLSSNTCRPQALVPEKEPWSVQSFGHGSSAMISTQPRPPPMERPPSGTPEPEGMDSPGSPKSSSVSTTTMPKSLPPGWKREVVVRKNGLSAGKSDVYYYRSVFVSVGVCVCVSE